MSVTEAQRAMREGRLQDAATHLRAILKTQPDSPELHYNLAMVLARLGQFPEAASHFEMCSRAAPDNPEILNNLANAQRLSGEGERALKNFDRALALAPGHPGALCNRAWLKLGAGDANSALPDFSAAVRADPDLSEAWRGLGECELAGNNWQAAEQALVRSLSLQPGSAASLNSLGVAAIKQENTGQALEFFERALQSQPNHVDALTNHGITCEQLGRLADAERSLERAVELRPGFAPAHFHLAHLAEHKPGTGERAAIETALAGNLASAARVDLEFALGKTLEKLANYDEAFPHFQAARNLLAERQPFDNAAERARLAKIIAAHSRDKPRGDSIGIVFVVGMPRSGTTLVDQILASHSRTNAVGESGRVGRVLHRMQGETRSVYPDGYRPPQSDFLAELNRILLPAGDTTGDHDLVIDTSPANFMYLGLLSDLLPGCRFVHCRRNPLDTCLSIFQHPLSRAHGYANQLESLAEYYLAYREVMAAWEERLEERIHHLDYETLIEEPEAEIRRLLTFCGLEFESTCLDFYRTERTVLTPSASQVRQPLSSKSVGRWRRYESFLGPLIERLA